MQFQRFGRTYQLRIASLADLRHVLDLDESLWMANNAPVNTFRCDPELLAMLDTDGDGRIVTHELKAAVHWLFARLKPEAGLHGGEDTLPLSAIRADTAEGQALHRSAQYALEHLGATDRATISLAQARKYADTVAGQPLNGDGVIVPEAVDDPELTEYIRDVLACTEAEQDKSGRKGVSQSSHELFQQEIDDYLDWLAQDPDATETGKTERRPLGRDTAQAYALYEANKKKIDLFFEYGRVLAFEPALEPRLALQDPQIAELDVTDRDALQAGLAQAPIARPGPAAALPLSADRVNPAYSDWIERFKSRVLEPLLGSSPRDTLSAADWTAVKAAFAPYAAYMAAKKGARVESLPIEKLRRYHPNPFAEPLRKMIEQDQAVADVVQGIRSLKRLLLYCRDLTRLANNYVSFPMLYDPAERALFEMGSAVIDGRRFNFAVRVHELGPHSAVAKSSDICILYLEVTPGTGPDHRFTVAVPVTAGTRGNLAVGKRGVFFTIDGEECDARVVRIIENPVSLREALVAPFVRLTEYVSARIETLSGTAEKGLLSQVQKTETAAVSGSAADASSPPAAPLFGGGGLAPSGLFLGFSVATAALGSAFAFILKTLKGVSKGRIAAGLAAAAALVVVPVTLVAIAKLRRQDLSVLLEGCGWGINARMRLNRAQRRYFTTCPAYPRNARGVPNRRRAILWGLLLGLLLLLALRILLK